MTYVSMRGPVRAAAVAAGLALAACGGSGEGIPDEDLAGLVLAPPDEPAPIDLEIAAADPAELARALAMPHRRVAAALGTHRFAGTSSVQVNEDGAVVESLSDETAIAWRDGGDFRARSDNSKDYGREAIFVDGMLHLRPGYGTYHRRAPIDPDEPAGIADELFATLGAYFELLAPGAELRDGGHDQVAGRDARRIELARAPEPGARPASSSPERAWRDRATVAELAGTVWLDAETGAPLAADVSGAVGFVREGRTFQMKLEVSHAVSDIGVPLEIEPPAEEDTVATPERLRELDEREELLRGIAPPAQTAPNPARPSGGRAAAENN